MGTSGVCRYVYVFRSLASALRFPFLRSCLPRRSGAPVWTRMHAILRVLGSQVGWQDLHEQWSREHSRRSLAQVKTPSDVLSASDGYLQPPRQAQHAERMYDVQPDPLFPGSLDRCQAVHNKEVKHTYAERAQRTPSPPAIRRLCAHFLNTPMRRCCFPPRASGQRHLFYDHSNSTSRYVVCTYVSPSGLIRVHEDS